MKPEILKKAERIGFANSSVRLVFYSYDFVKRKIVIWKRHNLCPKDQELQLDKLEYCSSG